MVLDYCAKQTYKIVEASPPGGSFEKYQINTISSSLIDTGTHLTTLQPLLNWKEFLDNAQLQEWVPELYLFALILNPEAWRKGKEFAPESCSKFPENDKALIQLNRFNVRNTTEQQLSILGVENAKAILDKVEEFIFNKAVDYLDGPFPYDEAVIDISFRLFSVLLKWISGEPLPTIEKLSRISHGSKQINGNPDRLRQLKERTSWLAVAMYRCLKHIQSFAEDRIPARKDAIGGRDIEVERPHSFQSLLPLSAQLRFGCPDEALPFFMRYRSKFGRHLASALVKEGIFVDQIMSWRPDEAVGKVFNALTKRGYEISRKNCKYFVIDVAHFTLKEDRELAYQMGREEGLDDYREAVRVSWKNFNSLHKKIVFGQEYIPKNNLLLIFQEMLQALNGLHSSREISSEDGLDQMEVRNLVTENSRILIKNNEITQCNISVGFILPEVDKSPEKIKPSGIRLPNHPRVTQKQLEEAVHGMAGGDISLLVGIPWFLPNAAVQLEEGVGAANIHSRPWVLLTAAGFFCLLTCIARGFVSLEMVCNKFNNLSAGCQFIPIQKMEDFFDMEKDMPQAIREAMHQYRDISYRKHERFS